MKLTKEMFITCTLICASAAAEAAQFTDMTTGEADIVVSRPVSALEVTYTSNTGLTTTMPNQTVVGTLIAKTTAPSNEIVGVKWSNTATQTPSPDGTNFLVAQISEVNNPEYKMTVAFEYPQPPKSIETDDEGTTYVVGDASGQFSTNIVYVESGTTELKPGIYKSSIDAAIYNP